MLLEKSPRIPTSSLSGNCISQSALRYLTVTAATAAELLIKRFWYRTKAKIRRMCSGGAPPGTCTIRPSPATRLPQEIIETIVACLIYNMPSLCSFALTCYSWYIAAVPHLHPTLQIVIDDFLGPVQSRSPIRHMHRLGFLPLVKTFRIRSFSADFSPKQSNQRFLCRFLELTNVQRLDIDNLDIPSFMPTIHKYFGPFLPTLRSLYLRLPKGSKRQIIFFIGLFQHLENLSLYGSRPREIGPEEDLTPIPHFAPPLRGRLVVWDWAETDLLQDMIRFFGGIRFSAMSLFNVPGTRYLLRACANTLLVLRLQLCDPVGEQS